MTASEIRELLRRELPPLLREDPSLRSELAELLGLGTAPPGRGSLWDTMEALAAEVKALAVEVRALAEAQKRTEARLEQLAAAQERTEARLERLAAAEERTEARLEQLAAAQERTEARLEQFGVVQQRLVQQVGALRGEATERRYRERASAYFGRLLRRIRVIDLGSLEDEIDAVLDPDERQDVLLLDMLISGRTGEREIWLAVEASATLDAHDVDRAARRAGLLRRLGRTVVAAVAGEAATDDARGKASEQLVALVQDGRVEGWEAALSAASL